jgi:hypothetical protein
LLLYSSYLPLGVSNWTVIYINTVPPQAMGRPYVCCSRLFSSARSPSPVRLRRHRPGLHRQCRHQFQSARRRPRHGMSCASIGLINRSSARLHQACPRACAYRRPSIGLPLCRPFGPQRRRLWSKPPTSNMSSKAHT